MPERENIFARIREALTVEAHAPGQHGQAHKPVGLPTTADHRRVLPAVGESFEQRLALFATNAAELRATFRLVKDLNELTAGLQALRDTEEWQRVATHEGLLAQPQAAGLGLPILVTDGGFDKHELERCDAGISECDALVAQTGGTVVVTSRTAGGRALSVLPPHHVVITRREQLVADLPAAFALIKAKHGANYPSMISLITGPSRTGDIERILVLGAHGPKSSRFFAYKSWEHWRLAGAFQGVS